MAEYLAAYGAQRPNDDGLLEYYGTLRAAHAYAKIIAARAGCRPSVHSPRWLLMATPGTFHSGPKFA